MLRNYFFSYIILLFTFLMGCTEESFDKRFSYEPELPKAGEEIKIKYLAAGTELEDASELKLFVYYYNDEVDDSKEVVMEKKGEGWIGYVKPGKDIYGMFIKFKSGEAVDNNEKKGYLIKLNDENNKPLAEAEAGYAAVISHWVSYYIEVDIDRDKAKQIYENTFVEHPELKDEFLEKYFVTVMRTMKEEGYPRIRAELELLEKKENKVEEDYSLITDWYSRIEYQEKSDNYKKQVLEKYPSGKIAESEHYKNFRNETDIDKKIVMAESFDNDFPNCDYTNTLYDLICNYYRDKKEYKKAYLFMKANSDKPSIYRFSSVANKIMENKGNTKYAYEIAKLGVERAEQEYLNPTSEKPGYFTEDEWKKDRGSYLGLNKYVLGKSLLMLDDRELALPLLKDAVDLTQGTDFENDEDIISTYPKALIENRKYDEAYLYLSNSIEEGKATSEMKDMLKKVYVELNGTEKGFDEYLTKISAKAEGTLVAKLKGEMFSESAPNFTLTDLDGKEISLSDFKGKVVIVDFWATWCGPCKSSFPGMQKAVDKFKDDPNVQFLFVNTWERVDDKKKNAQDFVDKNNYTFKVLMDYESKVIEQFKVSGIPTKFIIDGDGNTRFKSIGFNGNTDHLVDEISAMIKILNES